MQKLCIIALTLLISTSPHVTRSQEYRLFAARCLEIARTTADEQTKAVVLQMARVWSRLADEIEVALRESATGDAARE